MEVIVSFQGQRARLEDVSIDITVDELDKKVRSCLRLPPDASVKLLYKGKDLMMMRKTDKTDKAGGENVIFAFNDLMAASKTKTASIKPIKLLVLASTQETVSKLNSKKSDPTIRGFDQERSSRPRTNNDGTMENFWNTAGQDKDYKFCRFQACTWQSFGHRAVDTQTPHAFAAMNLLHKLATDPGIVAILKERELVVGTLGEMDPIDDRLKQSKEAQGVCLLGYNTNHGARIDLKLRPESLQGFLPYEQIVSTLIHELSHNWVGEHNLLFWNNFGQMRVEYLHKHASLAASGVVVNGQSTLQLAGVHLPDGMNSIVSVVLSELKAEMAQHGLTPDPIAPAILDRCRELTIKRRGSELGQAVGSSNSNNNNSQSQKSPRQLALEAAERRARQQKEDKEKEGADNNDSI